MSFLDRLKGLCDDSGIFVSKLGTIIPGLNINEYGTEERKPLYIKVFHVEQRSPAPLASTKQ